MCEIYTDSYSPLNIKGINNEDLDVFTQDSPFNFALEQGLEALGDPGALAEVVRLCALVVQVPVYSLLAQAIQELSKAVNKFQNYFNNKAGQMLIQLDVTKWHMAAA
jgi:hypothetical protein